MYMLCIGIWWIDGVGVLECSVLVRLDGPLLSILQKYKKMIHFLLSLCNQVWAKVSFFSWSIALDHFSYFHFSAKQLKKLTTHGQHPKFLLPSSESQTPSSSTTAPQNMTVTS